MGILHDWPYACGRVCFLFLRNINIKNKSFFICIKLSPALACTPLNLESVSRAVGLCFSNTLFGLICAKAIKTGAALASSPRPQYINQLISCTTSTLGPLTSTGIGSFVPVSTLLLVSQGCVRRLCVLKCVHIQRDPL